ncbi:hypothetical protein UK3_01307 [Enterococcus faecium EnGen0305]|nr:hypothetical protein UK3_01307 [Enterococcus faecium EnGen0305]
MLFVPDFLFMTLVSFARKMSETKKRAFLQVDEVALAIKV